MWISILIFEFFHLYHKSSPGINISYYFYILSATHEDKIKDKDDNHSILYCPTLYEYSFKYTFF